MYVKYELIVFVTLKISFNYCTVLRKVPVPIGTLHMYIPSTPFHREVTLTVRKLHGISHFQKNTTKPLHKYSYYLNVTHPSPPPSLNMAPGENRDVNPYPSHLCLL